MPITPADVERALAHSPDSVRVTYSDRDTLLYAVAVGLGRDPLDENALRYTSEINGQRVVPTTATVLARNAVRSQDVLRSKMNYAKLLHGEQRLRLHRPLPSAGEFDINTRIVGVYDKGKDKGALVLTESGAVLPDGEPLFTVGSTSFYRGDGGFGGTAEGAPTPHALPRRKPDTVCTLPQRPEQALIYALCGDRNPLHRDPVAARRSGFERPILHGLCSYGIACHAVLDQVVNYDATRILSFDARFSAPVYPGEAQTVDLWLDDDVVSFRVRVADREVIAINNGRCRIRI